MNTLQAIIISLSLGLLIVGVHQTFTVGFFASYWLFMLSLIMLFIYNFVKRRSDKQQPEGKVKKKSKKK